MRQLRFAWPEAKCHIFKGAVVHGSSRQFPDYLQLYFAVTAVTYIDLHQDLVSSMLHDAWPQRVIVF